MYILILLLDTDFKIHVKCIFFDTDYKYTPFIKYGSIPWHLSS